MSKIEKVISYIENSTAEMVQLQTLLNSIPALAPENGGDGEEEKAAALKIWLQENGFGEVEEIFIPDDRVKSGRRPNLIVTVPGEETDKVIWIMTHLDVVPPGERSLWQSDPYTVVEKDGRLYGRGVEDNQQGLVASVFAALGLLKNGVKPKSTLKLLFVSDEETGSDMGIKYLIREHDLFGPRDWFLIPDGGNKEGTMLEVAEKNLLWIKFHTQGKQCHASMPELGVNAFAAASALALKLHGLKDRFPEQNKIFDPPVSTFMPTKKEANVPNINTIPGDDVFYMDMRILPSVGAAAVLTEIDAVCQGVEGEYGVTIDYEIIQRVESKPTAEDAQLVRAMESVVEKVYQVQARPVGIGGGTVGAFLRNEGLDTVVWGKLDESAHMPNEYCIIDNLVGDAKVMAMLALEY